MECVIYQIVKAFFYSECHIRGSDVSRPTECEEIDDPMTIELLFQTTDSKTAKVKLRLRKVCYAA